MYEETAIGYVYILENDSMSGLIKIGKTSHNSSERARELSGTTGVPTPFKVVFEFRSKEYEKLEREMHSRLADYRVTSNREFFKYPVDKAISLLKKLDTEKQNGRGRICTPRALYWLSAPVSFRCSKAIWHRLDPTQYHKGHGRWCATIQKDEKRINCGN